MKIFEKCSFIDEVIECDYSCLASGFFNRVKALRQLTLFRADKIVQMVIFGRDGVHDYAALLPRSRESYSIETMNTLSEFPMPQAYKKIKKNFFNLLFTEVLDYDSSCTIRENEAKLLSIALKQKIYPGVANADFMEPLAPCQVSMSPFYLIVPGSESFSRCFPCW